MQRELGLERVVKLASNEGPFPPFPAALEAIERVAHELNRYPDGGVWAVRAALAERHGVAFEEVVVGSGADGVIDLLSQATLDPGDEIVCGWPSFPSYVLDAAKLGAVSKKVPLRNHTYDLDALLDGDRAAHEARLRLPSEQPDGHVERPRTSSRAFFDRVPEHVLVVLDQAYFEYIDDPDYADGIEDHFKEGRRVVVLRTFSKIYGLAGLRIGYGIAPADVVAATSKVRRAFDVTATAQAAALASIGDDAEIARRRAENARGRAQLEGVLREHGLEPAGPAFGNFLFADVGGGRALFEQLLRQGVIVRPLDGFGAPGAIRVSVGTHGRERVLRRAHWATSFRAYRPEPVTLLPCGGVVGRPSARQLAPLGLAGFRLLFLSTLGSSIGTLLAAIALAIDVKDRTNSGLWVGAVLVVEFLPTILVGLTLGPLLDRLERRRLMVVADLLRAAVFATLPFATSAGGDRRPRTRRRPRDRLLPPGGLRRRPEPRAGVSARQRQRALADGRERELGGRPDPRRPAHRRRGAACGVLDQCRLVPHLCGPRRAHPGAVASEHHGAHARALDGSEGRLLRGTALAPAPCRAARMGPGLARRAARSASARCSWRRTRCTQGTSATACSTAESAAASCSGASGAVRSSSATASPVHTDRGLR